MGGLSCACVFRVRAPPRKREANADTLLHLLFAWPGRSLLRARFGAIHELRPYIQAVINHAAKAVFIVAGEGEVGIALIAVLTLTRVLILTRILVVLVQPKVVLAIFDSTIFRR